MTIEELAEETGRAVSTLKSNFKGVKATLEKKGIIITQIKRGEYTIEYLENAGINTRKLMNYKFGKLQPLYPLEKRDRANHIIWHCKCDCGNETDVVSSDLIDGGTKSCGCLKVKDLSNQRFGKLIALYALEKRSNNGKLIWHCKCDCGNECDIVSNHLCNGNTQSCGCLKMSHGELQIQNLLDNFNIPYIKEYSAFQFKDTKGYARFDFYINNKYLIEFDGRQHFSPQNFGNYDDFEIVEQQFKKTKEHDEIKNQWCKNNNIPLIRIPYTHLKDLCLDDLLLETTNWRVI